MDRGLCPAPTLFVVLGKARALVDYIQSKCQLVALTITCEVVAALADVVPFLSSP
ncbi:hypothetical protein [Paenibacillus kribbensis]|uniref:hypothetical protein n=1 Tax=Paenibacillus kribbensis TaxID=172713 RepID=UPI0012FDB74A|nr:hypothetical protein [Paenibacillus kribbensis]